MEEVIQDQIKDTNSINNNNNVEVVRNGPSENNNGKDNNTQQATEATNTMTDQNTGNENNNDNTNNNINEDTKRPKKLVDTINCDKFQKPNGLVPRILYGLRGQRLIKLLSKNSQMYGNKLVLTWLNTPRAFERPRAIPDTPDDKNT